MSLLYITPLFLYFPTFFPGVETQPILALVVAAYGLIQSRHRKALLAFLGLSAFLLIWVTTRLAFSDSPDGSVTLMQLLAGPLVLFSALSLRAPPPLAAFWPLLPYVLLPRQHWKLSYLTFIRHWRLPCSHGQTSRMVTAAFLSSRRNPLMQQSPQYISSYWPYGPGCGGASVIAGSKFCCSYASCQRVQPMSYCCYWRGFSPGVLALRSQS